MGIRKLVNAVEVVYAGVMITKRIVLLLLGIGVVVAVMFWAFEYSRAVNWGS